jgi:tetratricopeptide (TPR) repeat protein
MISSRASFIGVGLIFIGYVFFQIYKYLKIEKNKIVFLNIGFYLVPLIFATVVNQVYFSKKGVDAIERASTIAINTSDDSISKRLRYYEDVLTHMLDNPIFGTGIGNWKFESIKYDRLQIDGYVVPYHAHSDFIQLGAELGFIGFFLYVFIFVSAIYFTYHIIFKSKIESKDKLFSFFLIISLGVYLIDANLNFPIARPQELAPMTLVLALINYYYIRSRSKKKNKGIVAANLIKNGFPILALIFLIPSFSVTYKTYISQINQMTILQDFNNDQYNLSFNQIESHVKSIPDVTVTTIPMDAIKARYYFHYKKYDKALEYALKSESANPYLHYGDIIASRVYQVKGQKEKAKEFARKAFFGMPNNNLHIGEYLNIILDQKDSEALEEAYPLLTGTNKIMGWRSYLVTKSALTPSGDQIFIKRAEKAYKLFPYEDQFRQILKTAKIGQIRIDNAYKISQEAQERYNEALYSQAAMMYNDAIDLDPYEYSYYENAALCFYAVNDLDNALNRINVVVNEMNPLNGKCEYIKGLIYLKLGIIDDACSLFETSVATGFSTAISVQNQYCK